MDVSKIKKKYRNRLINREKQWPPCHGNKLVRLQLVERGKGEGYSANIQRGREDKTVKRTPLAYGDLFKAESGKKPVRKVLVEGDAGIGKTTLSINLSGDWACGKLFQEFELLLLLPLRHIEVASARSLPELFKLLHPSTDVCKSFTSYLEKEEEKVLIIADGWDELSESDQQEGSFLYELLFETFPLMSVVVTSRPSASAPLHRFPCFDRFVEINGFREEDIKEYILSEFPNDQQMASRLLKQLEDNPLVESVCSVPLNCAIICHLWRTLKQALPSTMTQLYTKIILNVILRNIQKSEAFKNVLSLPNFNALPKVLQHSFRLLCEFAFNSLKKDQIVFSREVLVEFFPEGLSLDEKILCFGLLQSAETVLETGHGVSFHFLHLTFMEYLAALHLVEQPQDKQLEVFSLKDNDPYASSRFTMVWKFFFGFCFSHSNVVADDVITQAIDYINRTGSDLKKDVVLCHCACEAKNSSITNEVIPLIDCKLNFSSFGIPRTAYDCAAILYTISNIEKRSSLKISFSNCGIREDQIRTLTDILASKQGKLKVKRLDLSGNKLTSKCLSDLFSRASVAFQSDTKYEPKSDALVLRMHFSITCGLSVLNLCDIPLGVCCLQVLKDAACEHLFSRLEHLDLTGSLSHDADTNCKCLSTFMDALSTYCPHLWSLGLGRNNLGVPGASALARGISKLQNQSASDVGFSLDLEEASLGDEGLKALIDNIEGVIYHLYLKGNHIHTPGVSYLADAVCSGKIVFHQKGLSYYIKLSIWSHGLDLSHNPLGLEGALAVGRMISSSHFQNQSVILSKCQLTTSGAVLPNTDSLEVSDSMSSESVLAVGLQLYQMRQNYTITRLQLDGNNFMGNGIHILTDFMYLCCSLEVLFCSNCGITSDDLKLLLDKLTQLKSSSPSLCSKLKMWFLKNNEIEDKGMSILISHLSSLFPYMRYGSINLENNPVSREMQTKLEEELRSRDDELEETLRLERSSSEFREDRSSIEGLSVDEEEPLSNADSLTRLPVSAGRAIGKNQEVEPPTSQTLCDVTQASSLTPASANLIGEQRSCDSSHVSSDDDEFFTPPSSPTPSQDDDIMIDKEVGPSLTVDDLASVQSKVWDGRATWYNIGLELGLTAGTLDAIKVDCNSYCGPCFTASLKFWLRSAELHPSWSSLASALRAPPVGLERMAEQLLNLDPSN